MISYFTSTIMVSVAGEKIKFYLGSQTYRSMANYFSQSAIKPDMKIKLRMEGAVNGHKFEITGEGKGKPFE